MRERSSTEERLANQPGNGGSIPARSLLFAWGMNDEAERLVRKFHYSRRKPGSVQFVGSLHLADGLLDMPGTMVAAAWFGTPAAQWKETVLELSRLVRSERAVPLTMLIAMSMRRLKKEGHDLAISYADKEQNHVGYVYQAAGWNYSGQRERQMLGVIIDGKAVHGRTCNHLYGTRSPEKLRAQLKCDVQPHFDEGKHLYWKALTASGIEKAKRLELTSQPYPKN